ncbi:MAG: hypothetical protein HUK23_04625 [Sphaerochaetaceae bacterium]|nr:hypothetical protein [Sphaerochaetaceae bacterium]
MKNRKSFIVILLLMCIAVSGLFAAATSEKVVTVKFSELDLESASFAEIKAAFEGEIEVYNSDYQLACNAINDAYQKGNAQDYYTARNNLRSLVYPSITSQQTDVLITRIANCDNAEEAKDFASWLYDNSRYYRPVVSFTRESSTSNSYYSFNYKKSVKPGTTISLPTVSNSSSEGVFIGWGLTPDEVTYSVSEEIEMPVLDQTFYAIYKKGVRYVDSITGLDEFIEDENAQEPELVGPDASYVFDGWTNNNGTYNAKWKSLSFDNVQAKYYKDLSVPANNQFTLNFSLENQGTVASGKLSISLVVEDGLRVLSKDLATANIAVGQSKTGSFTLMTTGTSGQVVSAKIVVTDSNSNIWEYPFEVTIK